MKKFLVLSAVTSVAIACIAVFVSFSQAGPSEVSASNGRSWSITSVDNDFRVLGNGRLGVREQFGIDYSGHFEGFKRDLDLRRGQSINDVRAGESSQEYQPGASAAQGSSGDPGTFGTAASASGFSTVWHHNSTDQQRKFWQSFQVDGVGKRYSDYDVLPLTLWGDKWQSSTEKVTARIVFPRGLPKGYQVIIEPAWLGYKTRAIDRNTIMISGENTAGNQLVKANIRLPRGYLGQGVVLVNNKAPLPPTEGKWGQFSRWLSGTPVMLFLFFVAGFWLLAVLPAWLWFRNRRRRYQDAEWQIDGPVYQPPAQPLGYGYVAAEEEAPALSRLVTATMLDLVARGFYWRDNVRDETSGEWRLKIALPQTRSQQPNSAGEQALMHWLDDLLQQGPCIVDDLQERLDDSVKTREAWTSMTLKLTADYKSIHQAQESHSGSVRFSAWLIGAVGTVILFVAVFAGAKSVATGLFISGFALLVLWSMAVSSWPSGDFVYSGKELSKVHAEWQAWRDWILHFDQMETAPDLQIILWERAFAGAVLWGVASEFTRRAAVVVPALQESSPGMMSFSSGAAPGWGSSISNTIAPSQSGGDGGGDLSGGGGDFGGGGGDSW